MAIMKCPECRRGVSTKAAACPGCGAPVAIPVLTVEAASGRFTSDRWAAVVIVGAVLLVSAIAAVIGRATTSDAAQQQAAAADDANCRHDLHCWGEKAWAGAETYCPPEIERKAKYSVRWLDSHWYEHKLTRYRWLSEPAGTVTMLGDKAEFQNGFGAFAVVTYECDFDPYSDKVLGVRVYEGRLP